ncbi:MAG: type II secretion system protein [Clostridium sp.]|uniref:type II secretion system protein n=1 Tax=Clostridium sp. TaxID=1506 RepID=UPI003F359E7C
MRKNKKKKGFTLIEVVAGLAVFAVVSTVIMSMILNVNKYNAENKNQFDASAMSRAFNEGIKSIRPVDNERAAGLKGYPDAWKEVTTGGTPTDSVPRYYYIGFDEIDGLNRAIKESLLKDASFTVTNPNPTVSKYYIKEITDTDTIESFLNNTEAQKYKYGIKIKVQNKVAEKVYVFDTQTIDIPGGITTVADRKFAISSIA